ncbi:MAG TPA: protein kinase [Acidimicrobiales bacterium]|nr:protein kinase [Acidimicrobiales bacterium]
MTERTVKLGINGLTDAVEIGRGGFSSVYRALQPAFDRFVAVKIFDNVSMDADSQTFQRECRAIGRISGRANILTVHDAGMTESGRAFMVMAYMQRGSLADQLAGHGPLPWRDAIEIGAKLAQALQVAHDAGILHRDVKPNNVLVSDDGEPLLADFGSARLIDVTGKTMSRPSFTPAHVAPEVLMGEPPTAAVDVYSLASTLFELITGRPAFVELDDDNLFSIMRRVEQAPLPDLLRPLGVPESICQAIETAMAKEPARRPPSARAFRAELITALDEEDAAAERAKAAQAIESPPPSPPPLRPRPWTPPPEGMPETPSLREPVLPAALPGRPRSASPAAPGDGSAAQPPAATPAPAGEPPEGPPAATPASAGEPPGGPPPALAPLRRRYDVPKGPAWPERRDVHVGVGAPNRRPIVDGRSPVPPARRGAAIRSPMVATSKGPPGSVARSRRQKTVVAVSAIVTVVVALVVASVAAALASHGSSKNNNNNKSTGPGRSGSPQEALASFLASPNGVVTSSAGTVFVSDFGNHRVRRINPDGTITTVAGDGQAGFSGDGGSAASAELSEPGGLALDAAGDLYIADVGNNRIRRVTPAGAISTVAGDSLAGYTGDNGRAIDAELNEPQGVAIGPDNSIYIADFGNNRIRRVTPGGMITTVAGDGQGGFNGSKLATGAELNEPTGVAVAGGDLYIADFGNNRVRRVTSGIITTFAGNDMAGSGGDNGQAINAQLDGPEAVAISRSGGVYITDLGHSEIRFVNTGGIIMTVGGSGIAGFGGDNGAATAARINNPVGITVSQDGSVYIADSGNNRVRKIAGGIMTTVAGNGEGAFAGDGGPPRAAQISEPMGVAVSSNGDLYITDTGNNRIRMVSHGTITTVAGTGEAGFSGDGGAATAAELNAPTGLAVSAVGDLYIADTANHRIRMVSRAGVITTVAGNGQEGTQATDPNGDGGAAIQAELHAPVSVAIGPDGKSIFIADETNNRIRVVNANRIMTRFAGNGNPGYSGDGGSAINAELDAPEGVAVAADGDVYVADTGNNRVRWISPGGVITTLAGGTAATLGAPIGITVVSSQGSEHTNVVYVAASGANVVDRVDSTGLITPVAGDGQAGFAGDNGPAVAAQLNSPNDVAVGPDQVISIADLQNNRIRQVDASGVMTTLAGVVDQR